ncbi:MAG TPA: SulP family inorganic anion transporter [Gammaproteobacteria bacterium]|nr:SulP family inorganic anion transporter [Gammaproteobacteria bacterium]
MRQDATLIRRYLPFLRWWPRVNRDSLRHDLLAGLTGAIVVLPQGVAFATIAGMPPQYGLYAGMIPAIVAALFGSSWHLVSGPTTAASVVLFSTLSPYALPGSAEYVTLALTLTLMVGVFQLALGILRLGTLVDFISHTVVVGFITGAAILIFASQIPGFLGLSSTNRWAFHDIPMQLIAHIDEVNPYSLAVGVLALATGILTLRRFPKLPYMLAAMLAGSIAAFLLDLVLGNETTALRTIGALPAGLPPLTLPAVSFETISRLAPAAAAITLLVLTESITIGRALALKSGQHLDSNQEFIGQGLSNLAASCCSGYVATGSFNRSGVNYEAGARTPLSAVFAGLLLMAIVVFIAPATAYLPNAAMAGVLFLVAWQLIDLKRIIKIFRTSRTEAAILALTITTALFVGLEYAILLGVVFGLLLFVMDTARPRIFSRVPNPNTPNRDFVTDATLPECPQVKFLRLDGDLYFGSTHHVERMLEIYRQRQTNQSHLLLICSGINEIDISGAELLGDEARKRNADGGGLYLYRIKPAVEEFLTRGGYMTEIGEDHQFSKKSEAISRIFEQLDRSICARCEHRIFLECASVPGPSTPQGNEITATTTE